MENRFGVRDLIQAALLLAIIVVICITMFQIDRQWRVLQDMKKQMLAQTQYTADLFKAQQEQASNPEILQLQEELRKLRQTLEKGVAVAGQAETQAATQTTTQAATQPPVEQASEVAIASQGATEDGITWGPIVGAEMDPFADIKAAQKLPGYAAQDYFVDVFSVTPDKLTPLISSDAYGSMIQDKILESLAQRDPDTLQWTPLLAKWWRISEDGLNIEFEMRTNARFSDNRPVTADDVVFTFAWIMNPAVEAPRQRAYYRMIESVKKVGPNRVRFTFKAPYFQAFELAAGMAVLPRHFYEKYTPSQFNRSTGLLLGSGPYRLANPTSWTPEPGKPIEIYRNERYWGPQPPFARLIWRVIKEDATRLTAFRNGEIDAMYPTPEQYIGMMKDPSLIDKTQHFEMQRPNAGYLFVAWAQKKDGKATIFADARVRRAMTMLIDRQAICEKIFYGYATPITGPFSILSPQTNPDIQPWPFDIEKGKALLTQAGFADRNGDGVLDGPDGRPLRIKLSYPATSETFNRMVLLIKDNFMRAGVLLEEDPLEWNVLLQRINDRALEAYSLGWSGSIEGDPFQIFHSSMIEGTGDNSVSYANPALDKLIEQARSTVDEEKRMPLWRAVHAILHEDQPYTFLLTRKSLVFMDDRVENVKVVKTGLNPQMQWYVPGKDVKWNK